MYRDEHITIVDEILTDREGRHFSAWFVFHQDRVISVEFTRRDSLATDRIELSEAA